MILAYHRVNPWYPDDALSVSPEMFRQQLSFLLSHGWEPLTPEQLLTDMIGVPRRQSSRKWFLVTLDDSYADNFWFGLPILKELGLPAIIFLAVGSVNTGELMPRYHQPEKDRFLTWQEIEEMKANGIVFGSHSLSHRRLVDLPPEAASREIVLSRQILEEKLRCPVYFFCYPYGAWNNQLVSLVASAGFQAAMVTNVKTTRFSPFTLPRIGIYSHINPLTFRLKVRLGLWKEKRYFASF